MLQGKLDSLCELTIEANMLRSINFKDVISDFSKMKCTKMHFRS